MGRGLTGQLESTQIPMVINKTVYKPPPWNFFAFVDCLIKADTPPKVKLTYYERVGVLRPRDALTPNITRHSLKRLLRVDSQDTRVSIKKVASGDPMTNPFARIGAVRQLRTMINTR